MSIVENPFTPSFGEIPTCMAGREQVLANLTRALESERRRPELTTIFSGARGTGKTTMLSLVSEKAIEQGWIAASVTAMPGMLEDIEIQTRKHAAHLLEPQNGARISSVGIPQVLEVEISRQAGTASNWRSRMDDILDALEQTGAGLLISVDELDSRLDEMVQLAAVYQHFVREGRKVALLMAGLPNEISSILNDRTVSFLRRAQIIQLGRIDDFEIEAALAKTIRKGGRTSQTRDLQEAVAAINGFPFMMQLVGFRAWDENPQAEQVTANDFRQGIELARKEMSARILDATYRDLSPADLEFVEAMLADEGDSKIADIVARLGWSSSQVAQYRKRLIDAGVIGERRRGVVGFDMPFFREYAREASSNKH